MFLKLINTIESNFFRIIFWNCNNFSFKNGVIVIDKVAKKKLKQIPNDISGYVKDAIKDSKKKSIYRIDLVGSLCRFEGVEQISSNIFELNLGS